MILASTSNKPNARIKRHKGSNKGMNTYRVIYRQESYSRTEARQTPKTLHSARYLALCYLAQTPNSEVTILSPSGRVSTVMSNA